MKLKIEDKFKLYRLKDVVLRRMAETQDLAQAREAVMQQTSLILQREEDSARRYVSALRELLEGEGLDEVSDAELVMAPIHYEIGLIKLPDPAPAPAPLAPPTDAAPEEPTDAAPEEPDPELLCEAPSTLSEDEA